MKALVANAGHPSSLAVIRSLGRKKIAVTGVSIKKGDAPLYSRFCRNRVYYNTKRKSFEDYTDELLDIVKKDHYDVFIPVMGQKQLLLLLKSRDVFEKYTRIALPSLEQFSILNNKAEVAHLLSTHHIPGPYTYLIDSVDQLKKIKKEADFPVIIKPHIGEGAEGVTTVFHPEDLFKAYYEIKEKYDRVLIQEYLQGIKHTAVFLLNSQSEARMFFVHRAIREYPVSGGPTCFLESVKYDPIYEYGMKLLKLINFSGLASMEFIIDQKDHLPKIIDVNPRIYGPIQCAISAGANIPYALYMMTKDGDIETDFSYREGVTCRHLLFQDTKHLISILKGVKSPKYQQGKVAALLNYLNFFRDDSYFILSASDPLPAIRKIFLRLTYPVKKET